MIPILGYLLTAAVFAFIAYQMIYGGPRHRG